jgi:hypothetical protein
MENRKIFDISLNVEKLREQKEHFVEGKKGTYLDLRIIELENKQYNDFMVVVKVKKEEYDKGVKGDIVGYGKDWGRDRSEAPAKSSAPTSADDLPF